MIQTEETWSHYFTEYVNFCPCPPSVLKEFYEGRNYPIE